ncbi:NADPH2:quinone reductase [Oxalobacteraceae bacterium GrIS 1.11]
MYREHIAATIRAYGDADVLRIESYEPAPPGPGEIRIRQHAIGVNFVDIYQRSGLYRFPALPAIPGVEGAGTVVALGAGVDGFERGQRVAYAGVAGGYASVRNLPASRAIALPDGVTDECAAGAMLRGITAHMLFTDVRPLLAGDTVLVHAAAGGLGLVLVQWAKALGARVIGTVGSPAKADLALAHGLDHAVLYNKQDFVAATLALTDGKGVHFAIDGIGGATLARSVASVRPDGITASIGQVAGAIDDRALRGAVPALARPSVLSFMNDARRYRAGAAATLERLQAGLRIHIGADLPLREAALAHRSLEGGTTSGALLLRP